MQPLLRFVHWEEDLLSALETDLQVCRSDAQGIAEAQQDLVREAWNSGLSARETANRIIQSTHPEDRPHD